MNDRLRNLKSRISAHHVKNISVESNPTFQGPYLDTLYYYQNDDGTFIVQNGDYRIKDMPADELIQLISLVHSPEARRKWLEKWQGVRK